MPAPTVAVTVDLSTIGGEAVEGVTVRARLDVNEVYEEIVISKPVEAVTDANGVAILDLFPNAPDPTGLGTQGSTYRITAAIPGGRALNVNARVPNNDCRLETILVGDEVGPLSDAELAVLQAQASVSTAASSAAAAATSATAAATSATTAATSSTNAAASATAAAASEAAAVAGAASAQFADYDALRAYAGTSKNAVVTGYLVSTAPSGIAGIFTRDDADTTSADNGGTIIVASNGKRWKRVYTGPVDVRWFGAKGDGSTDDTAAIQATFDCGATGVLIPGREGEVYLTTGVEIDTSSAVREVITTGFPTLKLSAALNRVALTISKAQYVRVGDLRYLSSGTKGDGLNTVGLKLADGQSYMSFGHQRFEEFSGRGAQLIQTVYIGFDQVTAVNCVRGISLEKDGGGVQCTVTNIKRAYISSCTRGVFSDGGVNTTIEDLIIEYSGHATDVDGALHLIAGTTRIGTAYTEANERNLVMNDAKLVFGSRYWFPGTAADSISYSGTSFDERGVSMMTYEGITTPRINADDVANLDLTIGENLVVPVAGGSVQYGDLTTETIRGTAVSATWTTVKALSGQSGDGSSRVSYRYAIYAGRSDQTTGYDSGVILNGVIYSDTGSVPAWLRIDSGNFQIQITSATYGLDYGCTLVVNNAIGIA
jgi:hypothetical protein